MRILDMIVMSCANLWKRKIRTILTILGVVIGTASIVTMVAVGMGLNKSAMDQLDSYGALTTIQVSRKGSGMGGGSSNNTGEKSEIKRLDDAAVEELRALEHVKDVSPQLQTYVVVKKGNMTADVSLIGVPYSGLKEMDFKFAQGGLPEEDSSELSIIFGNMVLVQFHKKNGYSYYWETGQAPDIDLMNDTLFWMLDSSAYYGSSSNTPNSPSDMGSAGTDDEGAAANTGPPKKYRFPPAGVLEGTLEDYGQYSYSCYCDIDKLIPILKKEFKGRAVPGQPTKSSGRPYKEIFYTNIVVNADDMSHVADLTETINNMGYDAYSSSDWVQQQTEQFQMIQIALGAIGFITLLVAAIGIANTMMMSIYERTKEIGIYKVLGCAVRNIQFLFLYEAAFIGLIGGLIGLGLSYFLAFLLNDVVLNMNLEAFSQMTVLAVIPPWMVVVSVTFAVFIAMLAGYFPSRRAMKLSPLAAIRNE